MQHLGSVRHEGQPPSWVPLSEGIDADGPEDPDDRRLLVALAGGATVDAAARAINVSTRTAQRRLARLRQRLGAGNTTEAVDRWLAGRPDLPAEPDQPDVGSGSNS